MPPAAKRDLGVVLFDVSCTGRDVLKKALMKFITYNRCVSVKDKYTLLLFNYSQQGGHNFRFVEDSEEMDPEEIHQTIERAIDNHEAKPGHSGDWLDALLAAAVRLQNIKNLAGCITLQLIMYSSMDPTSKLFNAEKTKKLCDIVNKLGMFVYFVGPDVEPSTTIMNRLDIEEFVRNLKVDESNTSMTLVREIAQKTAHTVVCNAKLGFDWVMMYRMPKGLQPSKMGLAIGTKLYVSASHVTVYKRFRPLRVALANPPPRYLVLADDESVRVEESDTVRGSVFHDKFVKIDRRMFKEETERELDIVGFTDKSSIPEPYLRNEKVYYMLPGDNSSWLQAFYELVDVLHEQQKYAIISKVLNKGQKRRYFVLIPRPDLDPKCYLMCSLPFADDVKFEFEYEQQPEKSSDPVRDEFDDFFDSLDITREDSIARPAMSPQMMVDRYGSNLVNLCINKLTGKEYDFSDIEYPVFGERENEFAEALKAKWARSADGSSD